MGDDSSELLEQSEYADFLHYLKSHRLSEEDVRVDVTRIPGRGPIQPIARRIRITRLSNGVTRDYKAGHRGHWVLDFARDWEVGS
jgi:hypothetical protein